MTLWAGFFFVQFRFFLSCGQFCFGLMSKSILQLVLDLFTLLVADFFFHFFISWSVLLLPSVLIFEMQFLNFKIDRTTNK
jgi:hypothetical protein